MTIGQRIAEQRKQLGLSQEALGERLGVSRQAISKWEADAALPEIDKLIGLSKLFSVSVGWLLGVEELPEDTQTLSDAQLAAMEQLIRTYTVMPQTEQKRNRTPLVLSILALVLSAATLLTCLTHHNNLSNSLSSLSYQMMNLLSGYDTVRAQINDLETAAPESTVSSALHGFDFRLTPDTEEPRVTVQLSAVPKLRSDERAVFTARKDGAEAASAGCIFDGTAYTAELELDMADGYEYWLVLTTSGGITEQIPLPHSQAQNLKATFHMTCEIKNQGHLDYRNNELVLRDFEVHLNRPESIADSAVIHWNSIEVLLIQEGEETGRYALLSETDDLEFRNSAGFEFSHSYLAFPDIALADGDGLEIWVRASLSNGMECLEMVNSWRYEDGIFYGGELANQD